MKGLIRKGHIVLSDLPKKDIYNGMWIRYKRPKNKYVTNWLTVNINKGQHKYLLPKNINPRDITKIEIKCHTKQNISKI